MNISKDRHCSKCHGGPEIPNLSFSHPEIFEIFQQIVGEGAFLPKGMPNYGDRFSNQEIQNIKHYILSKTRINSVGIIGDAVETGWNESVPMNQIDESIWELDVYFKTGELKIRANNDWALNWGGKVLQNGDLIQNGPNFKLKEGHYHVVVNLGKYSYSIEERVD